MDVPIFRLDQYTSPNAHSPSGSRGECLPVQGAVELEITRGRVQQRIRRVKSKIFLIGAASDCDLVLGDLQFPEAFAYLFVNGSEVSIRRLGAGPELLVCGEPADTAELFHGDLLAFGPFELRVRLAPPVELPATRDELPAAHDEVESLLLDIRRGLADGERNATEDIPLSNLPCLVRSVSQGSSRSRLVSSDPALHMTAQSPIIGAIRLEPLAGDYSPGDSTLALVLESFAHRDSLAEDSAVRLVASTRLSRLSPSGDLTMGVRANLAQLLADLQVEYDELAERLPA